MLDEITVTAEKPLNLKLLDLTNTQESTYIPSPTYPEMPAAANRAMVIHHLNQSASGTGYLLRSPHLTNEEKAKALKSYMHNGPMASMYKDFMLMLVIELVTGPVGVGAVSIGGVGKLSVSQGVQYSDDLVRAAQNIYPKKAGNIELHHVTPKYLGGAEDGMRVPLDAAYHQCITNEFRALWPYGNKGVPSASELKNIMNQVYFKYPLPPGS